MNNLQALKNRLEQYKAQAEKVNSGTATRFIGPVYPAPITWREARLEWPLNEVRPQALKPANKTCYSEDRTKLYIDNFEDMPGYINDTDADKMARLDHTGWFADNFQDDTIRGVVIEFRNPQKFNTEHAEHDKTHIFYTIGTKHSTWDGVTVYPTEVFECAREAARRADSYAESEAEQCREDDAQFQAEKQIEELKEEYHAINKSTIALIRDVKKQTDIFPKTVCDLIRDEITEALEERAEKLNKIAKLQDEPWTAVSEW